MLTSIQEILNYNQWANERLINNINQISDADYFKTLAMPFSNIHELLSHLFYYDAKQYHQLTSGSSPEAKETSSRSGLAQAILFYSEEWLRWIKEAMKNDSKPNLLEATSNIIDLSIHNNYHRGQIHIAAHFLGYKPESLDIYIFREITRCQGRAVFSSC